MNPDRHSPQPGSSAYYAIRFAPSQRRAALRALHEVNHAIHCVHREIDDPGVAATKLAWWRNEIDQAHLGTPNHPALRQLQTQLKLPGHACWQALKDCITAAESDAQQSRYLDEAALLRQMRLNADSLAAAVTSILAPDHGTPPMAISTAMVAFNLVQIIRRLGHDARRGCLYVPIDELQQFDIKAHEILQIKSGLQQEVRFQNLMRHQAARARRYLREARSELTHEPLALRRFNAILIAHNSQLLDALDAANFAVLTQHIRLTPLRKLWLAWTTR